MSRLSWTIVWVLAYLATPIIGQENASSPHGEALRVDCRACHTTDSWLIDYDQLSFNHDTLSFGLTGQHKQVDCKSCHTSLVFNEAPLECASCHLDVHFQSLGTDCKRCHNTSAWIVDDVMEMHEQIAFPLIGVHAQVNCFQCHQNEEQVRFLPVGTECIDCHRENYVMANSPNHIQNGFSENCTDCHSVFDPDWKTDKIDHSFFPLTGGHDIQECARCHNVDNYSDISGECVSCHREEYNNTSNPNHAAANIGIDCKQCHTAEAEWVPADFVQHDMQYFPIYSGEHEGEWMQCVDCHTDPRDFGQFDCLICHINPETDNQHGTVQGYAYENHACLACHPTGSADESFDHNATDFPLTGAHTMISCEECHANGYQGTPTDCAACHQENYDQSKNPNHQRLGLSTDCASCHTTVPDWQPASFDVHDDFYPLNGAHELIKMDCATCHNGDYNNTPNTCFDCHRLEYDNTSDPDHNVLQFSQECLDCHNELAWVPSTFDHDMRFFPIYSGAHQGEWSECVDCHTTPGDYTQFTCVTCHTNPETNDVHQGVQGYSYNSSACLACHPTGDADVVFDHNNTAFPLTGAHTTTTCVECHANGYSGTPTQCEACHQEDYNQTTNPNHSTLGLRTDCASCHTTEPGWAPASFDVHDNFYVLEGAHNVIRNDCARCHNGDYNNTSNTCFACHQEDYEETSDPPHVSLNFSQDCASCHGQDNWVPSTFDHDGLYFPIYSGKHQNEWTECLDCHTNVANYSEFTCIGCHLNPETDDAHLGVQGYVYQDDACLACHPTGDADMSFDHNTTAFPLTGGHVGVDCIMCHSGGYVGTPTNCDACHGADYNSSSNPDHSRLGIPMDCASCHTTDPGWSPAGFDIHDQYYELKGAHAAIRNDCAVCHNGDYVNTPNTCVSCHQEDYDQTQNPSHKDAQFSTDCASCHTEDAWEPSTFDHDGMYFPVYTGTHMGTWNDCAECHTNPMDYAEFSCIGCHEHNMDDMDEKHMGVNGYSYNSIACLICHPTGLKDEGFDHGTTAFPLTGAHTMVACLDCHENGFVGTPTDCKECHQEHFDMTNNPDHGKLGISTDCAACHTTEPGWMPAAFPDHDSYYALTGAHDLVRSDCAKCHMGDYVNTPNTCDGCHLSDYNGSTNPNHSNPGLPRTCDDCHTTDPGWAPATFDIHDNYYALTGAHDLIRNDCAKCHMGDYTNTPNTCDGCHLPDYNGSTNPNHSRLGIPQTCDDCHTTDPGWAPATFDIHDNYYALTGAHNLVRNDCAKCHMGDYTNTPNTCDGCHLSDYNGSTNPNHATLGIPRTCDDCHTTDPGWAPASFDIHDNYYALTGAHNTIRNDCATCHMGDYVNTPNTCDGCHLSDYNGSTNPNHSSLGIPKTCDDCHTTDPGWMPATFDIHDNYYVLSGAHLIIKNDCFKCHMGSYNGTPNTCFGCHSTEYNNTTNPNHASAGFPVTCESCHSETAWLPSTWDHDNMYFPIYSGKHRNEWTQCVDCHTIPGVFTTYSCIDCHEHNDKTQVDDDHDKVTGYSYSSTACYSCHPTGEK